MTPPRVQHKAILVIAGRNVDIYAPPFATPAQLDAWIAESLKSEGVTLVSKSWADPDPDPKEAA